MNNINTDVQRKIRLQVAHILKAYGDKPAELMTQLEMLVQEWFQSGQILDNAA